ncbi:MAG TPA: hypothetical protein VI698_05070 [Nitrososphaerales archaeon]|nr:hypothetical protein [Nitrososphaerales archaeon]
MSKKVKKINVKAKKTKPEPKKEKEKPKKEPEPVSRVDINTQVYRDLFKFLEEKVSLECFIDLHDQCFGKTNCQCECHKK